MVIEENYLPVDQNTNQEENQQNLDYLFEPKKEIIKDLIPKSLKIQLFKAVLDSHASEHGARMTAMQGYR